MLSASGSWSTQQLAEFAVLVSSFDDPSSAGLVAVERVAEVFDAEVAAMVRDGGVAASVGFPRGKAPERELVVAAEGRSGSIVVPGLGECGAVSVRLDHARSGRLLVARHGNEPFSQDESDLLRGIGRVLGMALRTLERQALLERLSKLQRSIVRHADLKDVLHAIVEGACELLGDEVAGLRLLDATDSPRAKLVAAAGVDEDVIDAARVALVDDGPGGRAITEARLIVVEEYPRSPGASHRHAGIQASMAAPVYQGHEVVGSLIVASLRKGRTYSEDEQEVLRAFAEQANLALNDARAVERAMHQAFHDSLTGLPNRALFLDRLEQALLRRQRGGGSVAVLFADLDRFKAVNDSLGHAAGDQVLVEIGARLKRCLRPSDTAARFGGDEFAILLEDVPNAETAARAAGRMLEALEVPLRIHDREMLVSASVGIAVGNEDGSDLLRAADLAMYRAKSKGSGGKEVYEPGMRMEKLAS
jgi:diguanylate cyclase (GGDEF)-like protein